MCHPAWAAARVAAQRLDDLARLRRVRDRIDRECARPLDVLALAHAAGLPPALLSREFRSAYGLSPYAYVQARREERAAHLRRRTVPARTGAQSVTVTGRSSRSSAKSRSAFSSSQRTALPLGVARPTVLTGTLS